MYDPYSKHEATRVLGQESSKGFSARLPSRIEASIDARIGKVLARLVAMKEFKRTPAGNPLPQLT
jgi:hypothetical protein